MTTPVPIYTLPMFSSATSALHGMPAPARYGRVNGAGGLWDSISESFTNITNAVLPSLEAAAQRFVQSKLGYQTTGQQVSMRDGRVATLIKTPMGTLEALYADGTSEPYNPTQAASAPQSAASLLSGAGITGMTVGAVVGVGLIAWLLLRKKR